MATITDSAIVIRRWDFSETSQTVSLLTREHGIVRGLAKGAKRQKASFSGGLDLLHEGQVVAIVKRGRDLATLTDWHLERTHRVLHENLSANRSAMYMADLVHHLLIDHDPHPLVFDALSEALAAIDAEPSQAEAALLRLQWAALKEAGYQPQLDHHAQGAPGGQAGGQASGQGGGGGTLLFSPWAGGVVNPDAPGEALRRGGGGRGHQEAGGGGPWRVRRETIDLLRDLAAGQDISGRAVDGIRRGNRLLAAYCREIIGAEPAAMRWAFPDLTAPRQRQGDAPPA